jgi:hypothetical protein
MNSKFKQVPNILNRNKDILKRGGIGAAAGGVKAD